MAKTNWNIQDAVKPEDMNDIGGEINQLRTDLDNIDIPPASLTEAGIVQLSNATNSTSETMVPTLKAVKAAYDLAYTANVEAVAAQTTANAANLAAATVGPLSSLLTTTKTNTVAAINELFTNVSNGKTSVAAAITGKGVAASGSETFTQLAGKIGQIVTGKPFKVVSLGTITATWDNSSTRKVTEIHGVPFQPKTVIFMFTVWSVRGIFVASFDPIITNTYSQVYINDQVNRVSLTSQSDFYSDGCGVYIAGTIGAYVTYTDVNCLLIG